MGKPPISLVLTWLVAGSVAVATAGVATAASAQDTQLRLYGEPISYTDVADAFDDDDPIDINVTLQFSRESVSGSIEREINNPAVETGRASANYLPIADHERVRNVLTPALELGLFHDLAVFARLPIVLSDSRALTPTADGPMRLTERQPDGTSLQLFDFQSDGKFKAPDRSGVERIDVGLKWSIFNQFREPEYPTWLILLEGRFALGAPMHACNQAASFGATSCNGGDDPGVSDGNNWIRAETRASYRLRYVEPYTGLAFQAGFPGSASDLFKPGGDLAGFTNTSPPINGELTAGLAIIPWEQRARFQRVVFDLRLSGLYISEGHYYSPLFDALGTSTSTYLRTPVSEGVSMGSPSGRTVSFTGLTDVESHGRVSGQLAIELQAAQYVRFFLGAKLGWESPYTITYADACNPNVSPDGPSDSRQGTCRTGIINPHHRANIDLPGRRFRVNGEVLLDLFIGATGQF